MPSTPAGARHRVSIGRGMASARGRRTSVEFGEEIYRAGSAYWQPAEKNALADRAAAYSKHIFRRI
jgi:hypothetical protein